MDGQAGRDHGAGVGPLLRAYRLRMGADLDAASEALNIRRGFLEAIEDGRYHDLPGPAYISGFVRAYAEFLGIDGDEVVRRVRAETQGGKGPESLHFPEPVSESASPGGSIVLVGALIAMLAYGVWYVGTSRDGTVADLVAPLPDRLAALLPGGGTSQPSADPEPAAGFQPDAGAPGETAPDADPAPALAPATPAAPPSTPPADMRVADADAAATRPRRPENATDAAEPASPEHADETVLRGFATTDSEARGVPPRLVAGGSGAAIAGGSGLLPSAERPNDAAGNRTTHAPSAARAGETSTAIGARVVLTATERSWVEIRDPLGNRILSRIMAPGEAYQVPDQAGLRLTVGNAGGLEIRVNGQPIPALGGPGVVRRNVPLEPDRLQTRLANP